MPSAMCITSKQKIDCRLHLAHRQVKFQGYQIAKTVVTKRSKQATLGSAHQKKIPSVAHRIVPAHIYARHEIGKRYEATQDNLLTISDNEKCERLYTVEQFVEQLTCTVKSPALGRIRMFYDLGFLGKRCIFIQLEQLYTFYILYRLQITHELTSKS